MLSGPASRCAVGGSNGAARDDARLVAFSRSSLNLNS
jgi:hypothetical protein